MIRENIILALNIISGQPGLLIQVPGIKLSPLVRVIDDLANDLLKVVVSKMEITTQYRMISVVADFATAQLKGGKA